MRFRGRYRRQEHPAQAGRRRRRRVGVATVWVQCAVAVSGCGEDASRNSPVATAPATSPPTAADPPLVREPEVPECDVAGINERVGRQGTCVTGGVTRTVADRHRRLVLDGDVEIRLQDLAVRPRGSGRIVIASLRVRNLGRDRIRWPMTARQVALWADGRLIAQDPGGRLVALKASRPFGKPSVVLPAGGVSTVGVGWLLRPEDSGGMPSCVAHPPAAIAPTRCRLSVASVVVTSDCGRSTGVVAESSTVDAPARS